jgi:hypothetical protein
MKIVKEWLITCYWLVTVERRNWCEEFQPPWKEWREFCLLWIYELLWTCWLILVVRYRKEYDEIKRCEWMNRIYIWEEKRKGTKNANGVATTTRESCTEWVLFI